MAELVLTLAVPHTPLLWRLTGSAGEPDIDPVARRFARCRADLAAARPDVIVVVASDHFHQFSYDVMPAFCIGSADRWRGTYPNEERSFGLPPIELAGDTGFARMLMGRHLLPDAIDLAFTNRMRLDHAFVVPLLYLSPDLDIPIVPIHTNTNAPPLPGANRFAALGRHIGAVIDADPSNRRVAVVTTGHLAAELGGPRQFSGSTPSPEFDRRALEALGAGNMDALIELAQFETLLSAGNVTFQFLNFISALAVSGRPPDDADGVLCRFGTEPFIVWREQ
jgi:aromatic ring-opening dioxygenase catalytic subunit (LigB family)